MENHWYAFFTTNRESIIYHWYFISLNDENFGFIGFRLSYTCHKLDYYILDPKYDVCAIVNLESRDEIGENGKSG